MLQVSLSQSVSSVTQSCLTLCDPMNRSTPGLPVHHNLPESTHAHRVGDAIQPFHPLLSPSPPALNPSHHQGLFQWVSSSHEVAKVLGVSATSVLQMNTQDLSPSGWTGWISLQSKGLSWVLSNTIVQKHQSFCTQLFFMVQLSHPYMTIGETIALTRQTFVGKVMSLLFNMFCRLSIAFLPRSKGLLISWLQLPSSVILEAKKITSVTVSIVSPSICHKVMGPDAMILVFWMLSYKSAFSLSSFTFIKRLFNSSSLSAIRVVSSAYLRLLIFLAILIPACASSSLAFRNLYSVHIGLP